MNCGYCGGQTRLVKGAAIYGDKYPGGNFHLCSRCGAYVGCYPDSSVPLGTPANAELRRLRTNAHIAFDRLWKSGRMSRTEAYAWLSERMGVPKEECHIGMFNDDQCRKVAEISKRYLDREYYELINKR